MVLPVGWAACSAAASAGREGGREGGGELACDGRLEQQVGAVSFRGRVARGLWMEWASGLLLWAGEVDARCTMRGADGTARVGLPLRWPPPHVSLRQLLVLVLLVDVSLWQAPAVAGRHLGR